MGFGEFFGGGCEVGHDGLEGGTFGVVGPGGGFACGGFGVTEELSVGGEHGLVVGGVGGLAC